jgi:hypothetical protein
MIETKTEINYWHLMNKEIDEVFKNLNGITRCIDFFNKVKSNHFTDVLYISLTRSYDYMRHALEQKPLIQKRIFIIDCVSGFAFPTEKLTDVCLYHKPPRDIHIMKDIIHFGIEKTNPDIIVIDSLSQFINFSKSTDQEVDEFYAFLHSLRTQMLNLVTNTFILLFDTNLGEMANLPTQDVDTILKLEVNVPATDKQQLGLTSSEMTSQSSMISS